MAKNESAERTSHGILAQEEVAAQTDRASFGRRRLGSGGLGGAPSGYEDRRRRLAPTMTAPSANATAASGSGMGAPGSA
jgi:hypothetical protein